MLATAVGQRQFQFRSCLGRGGFGEVYRATMVSPGGLSAEVAVKLLRDDLDPRSEAVRRLRDEGRLLARLNHPTILRVVDLVELQGRVALVTEFVDGADLSAVFKRGLPVRPLLEVGAAVASALAAAWEAPFGVDGLPLRLVHRDVKPSNIRLGRHGEVRLLDFGIARSDEVEREARTSTDMMVGSPPYMAPERFLRPAAEPEADVFAVGAILYEGLTGKRWLDVPLPVIAGLAHQRPLYERHAERRMLELPNDLSPELRALLVACLAPEPTQRPSARALAAQLQEAADQLPGPGLARWAAGYSWPEGTVGGGELEGRLVTEGTLARASPTFGGAPLPAAAEGPPAGRRWWWLLPPAALVLLSGAGCLGASALGWWWGLPTAGTLAAVEAGPRPAPAPAATPAPLAAPQTPDPAVAEEAAVAPLPAAPAADLGAVPAVAPHRGDPAPAVAPASSAPPPEPALTPPPDPLPAVGPAPARVGLADPSGLRAELRGGPSPRSLPGEVAPGSYTLWVQFAEREAPFEVAVELAPGARATVTCNKRFFTCRLQ